MLPLLIGGIGIFLFGMSLMTEGLKSLGSKTLKTILRKFTSNRFNSLVVGFLITVAIQSSSATTLMTLGFVSAEIISFSSALGIVLGANLGTTVKAWLVATIGLKIDISAYALPLLGLASFIHLFGKNQLAYLGSTLAGFAMIFLGIGFMQQGMSGLSLQFSFSSLPANTFMAYLLLVGIGILMTVLMQSSSAAVATTLTALHTASINLEQAIPLVIGQNIGTTVTAILGAIKASLHAKRTAAANTFFNIITAAIVLLLLPLVLPPLLSLTKQAIWDETLLLSFFHTAFNVFGVVIFLPFTRFFARLMEKLIPGKKSSLTQHLDVSQEQLPSIALVSIAETLSDIAAAIFRKIRESITAETEKNLPNVEEMERALQQSKVVLANLNNPTAEDQKKALDAIHCIDHLQSLINACRETEKVKLLREIDSLREISYKFLNDCSPLFDWLSRKTSSINITLLEELSQDIANRRRNGRKETFELAAAKKINLEDTLARIEAIRWLDKTAYHLWRMSLHLVALKEEKKIPERKKRSLAENKPKSKASGVSKLA